MEKIIGREIEQKQLKNIIESNDAELLAIYGRRRIGKTYLIRNAYEKQLIFELSGVHNATLNQQLEVFGNAMSRATGFPIASPRNWSQAFTLLVEYIKPLIKKEKKVIFIDEFPWLHTPRSGFMQAFENFWNTWASKEKNLVVVICGSAAAWMIRNIIYNKGGLHNRVTRKIRLMPFTLGESEEFLKERKIILDRYQLIQLYMVMGGVPQYLKMVERGESSMLAIDRICFTKDGFLNDEFRNLFSSLFDEAAVHVNIIKTLAKKGKGLTRNEIIETCKLKSGGGTSQVLDELAESGFIGIFTPYGKTVKDSVYKLVDEYTLFYTKFIEHGKLKGAGSWAKYSRTQSWTSWSGYAFENICLKHIAQLKSALGIASVHTEHYMWRHTPQKDEIGAQIDLLIDRQDMCINLCEMKFSNTEFEITKSYAKELQTKMNVFIEKTKTRKTLFLTLVTTNGVKNTGNYIGLIQNEVKMDALFK
ncbi:ATP-binding protein [Sediminibacterium sp.]|uniref:AAA family ATPase n=1 Tax=Sediminibacterium sp. TaxID=1917865 RepID=UPI0025E134F4|nr:ATP-binding protein [Sediminibacterium sp.]MBT9483810.1 AAA family ATPase [Sediminibacterium sp.]